MKRVTVYGIVLFMLTSCAIGRKVNYDNVFIKVPAFNQKISIATWDQREQVVSGTRKPDFVGYSRSGAGIAYPIGSSSGKPFADIISADISSALSSKGSPTTVVITKTNEEESNILNELKKTGNNRLILINCKQLHTDGYVHISLLYNLKMNIYSHDGELLKEKTFNGKKSLESGGSEGYIAKAFKKLIEEIFNDEAIVSALKNS